MKLIDKNIFSKIEDWLDSKHYISNIINNRNIYDKVKLNIRYQPEGHELWEN